MTGLSTMQQRRRSGQVLVVTLLAIVLLVGLIFFVLNLGGQINRRVAAQNAADAAAASGAVHMARSMNSVAMTNVSMSRMLAAIVTLDGLERYTVASYDQAGVFHERMIIQAAAALPSDNLQNATRTALVNIRDRLLTERQLLADYVPVVQSLDLHSRTTYSLPDQPGPPPHGAFWWAAADLDAFNQATVEAAGILAQHSASRHAVAAQADGGFLLPIIPTIPAVRGGWGDWYRNPSRRASLLVHGWPPELPFGPRDRQDDELVAHRGPFFTLMGWRDSSRSRQAEQSAWLPGGSRYGSRPGQPTWTSSGPVTSYRGYGPAEWMERNVYYYWRHRLHYSIPHYVRGRRIQPLLDGLQRVKLDYMFSPTFGAPRRLHDPEWENDYYVARDRADGSRNVPVELTAHFRIEYFGPYAPDDARIISILDDPQHSNVHDPAWLPEPGWRDRETDDTRVPLRIRLTVRLSPPPQSTWPDAVEIPDEITIGIVLRVRRRWTKVAEHIWERSVSPEAWAEALDEYDRSGRLWGRIRGRLELPRDFPRFEYSYDVPEFDWYLARDAFVGADFGEDTDVHNPANFPATDYPDALPRPYLLDMANADYEARDGIDPWDDVGHNESDRRHLFTYLAAAASDASPTVWPNRFASGNPAGRIVAVAQAQVFNTTSWDLWTQDWRAQLVPVTELDRWHERLADDLELYQDVRAHEDRGGILDMAEMDAILEYFDALTQEGDALDELTKH